MFAHNWGLGNGGDYGFVFFPVLGAITRLSLRAPGREPVEAAFSQKTPLGQHVTEGNNPPPAGSELSPRLAPPFRWMDWPES